MSKTNADSLLLTATEAAAFLGVAVSYVREKSRRRHNPIPTVTLPGLKQVRYTKESLIEWVARYTDYGNQIDEARLEETRRKLRKSIE